MTVRIVFANGSRALAHNLDDLYLRWQMHRSEIESEHLDGNRAFVDYTNPKSLEEAYEMRDGLLKRRSEIEAWLGNKGQHVSELGYRLTLPQYRKLRAELLAELEYLSACGRMLKEYISIQKRKIFTETRSRTTEAALAIGKEVGDAWYIIQAYFLLLHLLQDNRSTLTPEEDIIFVALRERVMKEIPED